MVPELCHDRAARNCVSGPARQSRSLDLNQFHYHCAAGARWVMESLASVALGWTTDYRPPSACLHGLRPPAKADGRQSLSAACHRPFQVLRSLLKVIYIMNRYRFVQLDVFTDHAFSGNPLAVFPEAAGLSDEVMMKIAREMNLSETVFVLESENPEVLRRLRIYTPAREIPFAGHPVVGTWNALAL